MTCENCVAFSTIRSEFSEVKSDLKLLIRLVSLLLTENNVHAASLLLASNELVQNGLQQQLPVYCADVQEQPPGSETEEIHNEAIQVKIEELPASDAPVFADQLMGEMANDPADNSKVFSVDADCSRYEADAGSLLVANLPHTSTLPALPSNNFYEPSASVEVPSFHSSCHYKPIVFDSGEAGFNVPCGVNALPKPHIQLPEACKDPPMKKSLISAAIQNGLASKALKKGNKIGQAAANFKAKEPEPLPELNMTREEFMAVNGPSFECKVCGIRFDLWRKFKKHRKMHLPKRFIDCPNCERHFGTKHHMRRHVAELRMPVHSAANHSSGLKCVTSMN